MGEICITERGRVSAVNGNVFVVESLDRTGIVCPNVIALNRATYTVGDLVYYAAFNDGTGCILSGGQSIIEKMSLIFYQTEAPTSGMLPGDTWIDTDGGNALHEYTESLQWELRPFGVGSIEAHSIRPIEINVDYISAIASNIGEITAGQMHSNGYQGPAAGSQYSTAGMLIDLDNKVIRAPQFAVDANGKLYAAGAEIGGTIVVGGANNIDGTITIKDAAGAVIGSWTNAGINATAGSIGDWEIVEGSLRGYYDGEIRAVINPYLGIEFFEPNDLGYIQIYNYGRINARTTHALNDLFWSLEDAIAGDELRIYPVGISYRDDNDEYDLLRNRGNGNVSVSASSGILYLGYENTTGINLLNGTATVTSTGLTAGNITATGSFYGSLSGNATSASYLQGFSSRSTTAAWGNQDGTVISALNTAGSGGLVFRQNGTQLNVVIDGVFYQNEGNNLVLDSANYSSYALPLSGGTLTGDLTTNGWMRGNSGLVIANANITKGSNPSSNQERWIVFTDKDGYGSMTGDAMAGICSYVETNGASSLLLRAIKNNTSALATAQIAIKYPASGDASITLGAATTVGGTLSVTGQITASGGVLIPDNKNLVLRAAASSVNDPGDIIFQKNDGTEAGHIFSNGSALYFRMNSSGGNICSMDSTALIAGKDLWAGASAQDTLPNANIHIHDCRNVLLTPGHGDKGANFFFLCSGTGNNVLPETGKWASVLHVRGWAGAYSSWEIAGPANSTDQSSDPLYVRTSDRNSSWGSWRKILDSGNYSSYALPLSGGTLTGNITLASGAGLYGTDSTSTSYALIYDNGDNLWIGARSSSYHHHTGASGGTYISSGYNATSGTGNSTIYVSVPSLSGTTWTHTARAVLHSGNYSSYALPLSGGTLTGGLVVNTYVTAKNGMILRNEDYTKGTNPSTATARTIRFTDKDGYSTIAGDLVGLIESGSNTSGMQYVLMRTYNANTSGTLNAQVMVAYPKDGTPYFEISPLTYARGDVYVGPEKAADYTQQGIKLGANGNITLTKSGTGTGAGIYFAYNSSTVLTSGIYESSAGNLVFNANMQLANGKNIDCGASSSTASQFFRVRNSEHIGSLLSQAGTGRLGIYSNTQNGWLLYIGNSTTDNSLYIPRLVNVTGGVLSGSTSATTNQYFSVRNTGHSGSFISEQSTGRLGIWSVTLDDWFACVDAGGKPYIRGLGGGLHHPIITPQNTGNTVGQAVATIRGGPGVMEMHGLWGNSSTWAWKECGVYDSDIRLKENINACTVSALPVINAIQVREFDWKDGRGHQSIGVVADELETIDKGFVLGEGGYAEDGAMRVKSINLLYMLGYLVKAVQELAAEVERLKGATA